MLGSPVVVAGSQVQWGVPALILDIRVGIRLQQQLAELRLQRTAPPAASGATGLHA